MRTHHFLYALIGLILCSLPLQGQSRQNISLKFMGLSFHPLSGRPNAKLMPNRLDPEAYFVVDLGAYSPTSTSSSPRSSPSRVSKGFMLTAPPSSLV